MSQNELNYLYMAINLVSVPVVTYGMIAAIIFDQKENTKYQGDIIGLFVMGYIIPALLIAKSSMASYGYFSLLIL